MNPQPSNSPGAKSEEGFLSWGRCPQTPGIYRFPARMAVLFGAAGAAPPFRPLDRRSGRIPALPYLPAQVRSV